MLLLILCISLPIYVFGYSLYFTPNYMNMSDTCKGQVALAPNIGYAMTICLQNSTNNTIIGSCKSYTSGTYGVGNNIFTNDISDSLINNNSYRLLINWTRIQYINMNNSALNNYYDTGASDYSSHYTKCIKNEIPNSSLYCGNPIYTVNMTAGYECPSAIVYSASNDCLAATCNTRAGLFYSKQNCVTPVTNSKTYVAGKEYNRIYEGQTPSAGTTATIGGCTKFYGEGTSVDGENGNCACFNIGGDARYVATSCSDGNSDFSNSLCSNYSSYAYSSFFVYNSTLTIASSNFTNNLLSGGTIYSSNYVNNTLSYCTSGNMTINFTLYNEDLVNQKINSSVELQINYGVDNLFHYTYTFNISNTNNFGLCINQFNISILANIYIKQTNINSGLVHRWYSYNTNLTNLTQQVALFNFNSTNGLSDLKFTMRNKNNYNYLPDIVVLLQRLYLESGNTVWRTVQVDKSDSFGLTLFDIKESTTDYKLLLYNTNNTLLKTYDSMKFYCTSGLCDLTAIIDPASYISTKQWDVSMSYDNLTKIITLNFNNPSGTSAVINISILQNNTIICSNQAVSSGGTIICNLAGKSYAGLVYVLLKINGVNSFGEWLDLGKTSLANFINTKDQSIISFIIGVVCLGFGIASGVGAIISIIIALILIKLLGILSPLTVTIIITLGIIGIIIGVKVRR